jgi:bacterioferritin-associated ferredoxin
VIVCLCHGQSDRDIRRVIDRGASSVADVGEGCGAGTGCGKCRETIHDLLEDAGQSCRGCASCPILAGEAA